MLWGIYLWTSFNEEMIPRKVKGRAVRSRMVPQRNSKSRTFNGWLRKVSLAHCFPNYAWSWLMEADACLPSLPPWLAKIQNRRVLKKPNIDLKAFSLFGHKAKSVIKKAELLSWTWINLFSPRFLSLCLMFWCAPFYWFRVVSYKRQSVLKVSSVYFSVDNFSFLKVIPQK